MEEEDEHMLPTPPPFWLQNTQTNHHHRHHHRYLRRSYSLLLTSSSLIILLLITSLAFIFVVLPTLHSFASHIFKPHSVKKSWDSLNLLLVLFAIVCSFLSKNTETETEEISRFHQDRRNSFSSNAPFYRLRSFNSYPDLRLDSSLSDERWRFYDDTLLLLRHHRQQKLEAEQELVYSIATTVNSAVEEVATEQPPPSTLQPPVPPPQPLPSPSPPPSPHPQRSLPPPRRILRKKAAKRPDELDMTEKTGSDDLSAESLQPQPSMPPPPPSPPPLPPPPQHSPLIPAEKKLEHGNKKKRGTATKEFLTSLRGKKKKKQRHKSSENFDAVLNYDPVPLVSQPSSSPPPLRPPSSVFHNSFFPKKDSKRKRHVPPVVTCQPRLSNKRERSYDDDVMEDSVVMMGNESPLIPIPPPPPPPPPFKLPGWRFRVKGDFVRIDSIGSSSRSSASPDLDEGVESPISREGAAREGNSPSAFDSGGLFCPSPDVDAKANTFIERFRAGLKMEKMNSFKEKQGIRRSSLGPSYHPTSH